MPRPAGVNSEDTRAAILEGALRAFGRVGYSAAPLDEVAAFADITKGAIYWHFSSKAELFQGVIDLIGERFRAEVLGRARAEADPIARLRAVVLDYVAFVRSNPAVCTFLLQALLDEDAERRAAGERLFYQSTGVVARMIEEASPDTRAPESLADTFLAGLLGARVIAGTKRTKRTDALFDELGARMLERVDAGSAEPAR